MARRSVVLLTITIAVISTIGCRGSETTVAFYGNEDLLIDEGTFVMVYGKAKTRDAGKYVNIWMKEDGVWRIHSNMWNSNAPAARAR